VGRFNGLLDAGRGALTALCRSGSVPDELRSGRTLHMSAHGDRFEALKDELTDLLEARIGDLMGVVAATREITRQIIATEEEIRRQSMQHDTLERELGPLKNSSDGLEAENRDLQARVDRMKANVDRMRSLREELMSNLSNLKGEFDE
jgi:septal ring factor EnvC (AmiA/AmiB activator)